MAKAKLRAPHGAKTFNHGLDKYKVKDGHITIPEHLTPNAVSMGFVHIETIPDAVEEDDEDEGEGETESKAADPAKEDETLLGSSVQPSTFDVEGSDKPVPLGVVVAEAHKRSGLTVAAWNELSEDEREVQIDAVAKELPLKKAEA